MWVYRLGLVLSFLIVISGSTNGSRFLSFLAISYGVLLDINERTQKGCL